MTAVTEAPPRIVTLDIVRGVAVMGILAMNIVAFAMPPEAYMNPRAYGLDGVDDLISYVFSFILIDGKMRGLFSFLFGASILLVIEKAEAKDKSPASVHYRRMIWLLVFGFLHFFFIWHGDILTGYAMIGMIAYAFRRKATRSLLAWGIFFLIVQLAMMTSMAVMAHGLAAAVAAPSPPPEAVEGWKGMSAGFAVPTAAELEEHMQLYLGSWWGVAEHQLTQKAGAPFFMLFVFGWETLGYMLLGMWGLKSGFLTGAWTDAAYRRTALIGFGIAVPVYAALAWLIVRDGHTVPGIFTYGLAATTPIRPLMIAAIAALIILLTRRGGALAARISAAGQAAFTNYLGTSILMTAFFYGWGLGMFGAVGRAELWLVVIGMWVLMLLWSKPWLDRFQYGPFEWLWRSLSRWRVQPLRRPADAPAVVA